MFERKVFQYSELILVLSIGMELLKALFEKIQIYVGLMLSGNRGGVVLIMPPRLYKLISYLIYVLRAKVNECLYADSGSRDVWLNHSQYD